MAAAGSFGEVHEIPVSLNIDVKLGSGGFADVFRASYGGKSVAVKQLRTDKRIPFHAILSFHQEGRLQIGLKSEFIIQVYELLESLEFTIPARIIMEYAPNGSLHDILFSSMSKSIELPRTVRIEWLRQTAMGVRFLHGQKPSPVLHLDLKPDNILFDAGFTAKISDFGLAQWPGQSAQRGLVGNYRYIAPEWQANHGIERSVVLDVFAYGMVMDDSLRVYENRECSNPGVGTSPSDAFQEGLGVLAPIRVFPEELMSECRNADSTKKPSFEAIVRRFPSEIVPLEQLNSDQVKAYLENLRDSWKLETVQVPPEIGSAAFRNPYGMRVLARTHIKISQIIMNNNIISISGFRRRVLADVDASIGQLPSESSQISTMEAFRSAIKVLLNVFHPKSLYSPGSPSDIRNVALESTVGYCDRAVEHLERNSGLTDDYDYVMGAFCLGVKARCLARLGRTDEANDALTVALQLVHRFPTFFSKSDVFLARAKLLPYSDGSPDWSVDEQANAIRTALDCYGEENFLCEDEMSMRRHERIYELSIVHLHALQFHHDLAKTKAWWSRYMESSTIPTRHLQSAERYLGLLRVHPSAPPARKWPQSLPLGDRYVCSQAEVLLLLAKGDVCLAHERIREVRQALEDAATPVSDTVCYLKERIAELMKSRRKTAVAEPDVYL